VTARARRRSGPIQLHIDNCSSYDQVFWVTPERWAAAARRHRVLARRLQPWFAFDLDGFDEAMRSAGSGASLCILPNGPQTIPYCKL